MVEKTPADELKTVIDGHEQHYTEAWLEQGAFWERAGVYSKAAELITLNPGEIHLDLGAGSSPLLGNLKKTYPNAVFIGVDRNKFQLIAQAIRLHELNLVANILINTSIAVDQIRRSLTLLFKPHAEMRILDPLGIGKMNLVADDFRSMKVVAEILGNRKIDSASMLLSGVSQTPIYERPLPQEGSLMDQAEVRRRIRRFCTESQKAALLWLTQRMNLGGNLVLAERIAVKNGQREQAVGDVLQEMIPPELKAFWDFGKCTFLNCNLTTQGDGPFHMIQENGGLVGSPVPNPQDNTLVLTSPPEASQQGFTSDASLTVFVQQLKRNNLIFVP